MDARPVVTLVRSVHDGEHDFDCNGITNTIDAFFTIGPNHVKVHLSAKNMNVENEDDVTCSLTLQKQQSNGKDIAEAKLFSYDEVDFTWGTKATRTLLVASGLGTWKSVHEEEADVQESKAHEDRATTECRWFLADITMWLIDDADHPGSDKCEGSCHPDVSAFGELCHEGWSWSALDLPYEP